MKTDDEIFFRCISCGKYRLIKHSKTIKVGREITDPMDMNRIISYTQDMLICNMCYEESKVNEEI